MDESGIPQRHAAEATGRAPIGPADARLPNPRRYLGRQRRDAGEQLFAVSCEQPRFSDGTAER